MDHGMTAANRGSITSIDDLTDDEVIVIGRALKDDPVMTQMIGIAWAIGMVTGRPILLDNEESAQLLQARYQKLRGH